MKKPCPQDPFGFVCLPKDPWGNEYLYGVRDGRPRVVCLASDGAEGGEGEAADTVLP